MTAKEKALELSVKFHDHIRVELMEEGEVDYYGILAKQCALIAVDFALSIGVSPLDTIELNKVKQQIEEL